MTDDERALAINLAVCSFLPGTGVKRFARDMAFAASCAEPPPLTPKQREYLITAVIRYRRQIEPGIVKLAHTMKDAA